MIQDNIDLSRFHKQIQWNQHQLIAREIQIEEVFDVFRLFSATNLSNRTFFVKFMISKITHRIVK